MSKAKDQETVIEIPVTFGGLSVGDKMCRIGMSVSRASFTPAKADKHLIDKRLSVKLIAVPGGANGDQPSLPGLDNDREVAAVGDCKGYSATGMKLSFGLTFMLASVDVETLSHYPKRDGRLVVTGIEDIPEGEGDDDGEDD